MYVKASVRGDRPPGAGVPGVCEPPHASARNRTQGL